jgi:hypothetical protein
VKRQPADPREQSRRAALNALRRARRAAVRTGTDLSDWEGEFLGSIETRLTTFGRAFADPEKGGAGQALSVLQGRKLKEIRTKAEGGRMAAKPRSPRRERSEPNDT